MPWSHYAFAFAGSWRCVARVTKSLHVQGNPAACQAAAGPAQDTRTPCVLSHTLRGPKAARGVGRAMNGPPLVAKVCVLTCGRARVVSRDTARDGLALGSKLFQR